MISLKYGIDVRSIRVRPWFTFELGECVAADIGYLFTTGHAQTFYFLYGGLILPFGATGHAGSIA
jgi:hypothetical protein